MEEVLAEATLNQEMDQIETERRVNKGGIFGQRHQSVDVAAGRRNMRPLTLELNKPKMDEGLPAFAVELG